MKDRAGISDKDYVDARLEDLRHRLDGFPQEYAAKSEVASLDSSLDAIRSDHVTRHEFEALRAAQERGFRDVSGEMKEGQGRRVATVAILGLLGVLIALLFGLIERGQVSHAQISQQIAAESPWQADRAGVETHLTQIDRELADLTALIAAHKQSDAAFAARLAAIEKLDVFFCRSRTVKGLASC